MINDGRVIMLVFQQEYVGKFRINISIIRKGCVSVSNDVDRGKIKIGINDLRRIMPNGFVHDSQGILISFLSCYLKELSILK